MTWLNASRIHPHGISMDYILKAKAVSVYATKALRGIGGYLLLILDLGTRWE
jgi:hypothetical protein